MAKRLVYSNYDGDLRPNLARIAVSVNPLALEIIDGRKPEENAVADFGGDACTLSTREAHNG